MFTTSKEIEFDAGHRVPGHASKCRNPHGHRYKVRATITGELVTTPGAPDEGMLADFGDLKSLMISEIHDVLDHGFIVYKDDHLMQEALAVGNDIDTKWKVIEFPYIPTAENMARWCYKRLYAGIRTMGFELIDVSVWETPTSIATYRAAV